MKYCKFTGCRKTSETDEIKNDACAEHQIEIRATKAAKIKRAPHNKNKKKTMSTIDQYW